MTAADLGEFGREQAVADEFQNLAVVFQDRGGDDIEIIVQPGFAIWIAISLNFGADSYIRIINLRRSWELGHGVPDG